MTLPEHFRLHVSPTADPAALVTLPNARFTVLTDRLIRMEFAPDGRFEDRPSQAFWNRQQPAPKFSLRQSENGIEIDTGALRLRYQPDQAGFTRKTLSVEVRFTGKTWRPGEREWDNLRGTTRTLDGANGQVHLDPGLVSRAGWAVYDDTRSLVFNEEGWITPRQAHPAYQDLYFFGYGHEYLKCVRDFVVVSGPVPLLPRWALGNWWSRYWEYSQEDLAQLMDDFKAHQVPLSVCIIDMDWHITKTNNDSSGWTGYTWNRNLFQDPEGFLRGLHNRGLMTSLNLHPAEGIHPHEAQYPVLAERLGIDPSSGDPVPFDIADQAFALAYFDLLHHPEEQRGIDFWWIDWQQGGRTSLPGLDPLYWLNHLHFLDLGREGKRRPFIFSRWPGLGGHRYPIGFSGDTFVTWEELASQPAFTATAANVAYTWWSHDIGGHQGGVSDPELYARWVQYGLLSPILRLHSTKNAYLDWRPWAYDAEILRVTRQAMQLRHAFLPYLYTMNWLTHTQARPLVMPLYYLHPEVPEAYECPQEYTFGSELLAAPFTSPRTADTGLARQVVWLPEGEWFDFFSGQAYTGGRWQVLYGRLEDIPLFAKAGAVVPLQPQVGWGGVTNPASLDIHFFAGADGSFNLYEDDGDSQAYLQGQSCQTIFTQHWDGTTLDFEISPARGDTSFLPMTRQYRLVFHGIANPEQVEVTIDGQAAFPEAVYDGETETMTLSRLVLGTGQGLQGRLAANGGELRSRRDRRKELVRRALNSFRAEVNLKNRIDWALEDLLAGRKTLGSVSAGMTASQVDVLREVIENLK